MIKRFIESKYQYKDFSGIVYHRTNENSAAGIKKNGFVITDEGNQRFGVGIYFTFHADSQYGDSLVAAKVDGKFIDMTSDRFGHRWKEFKNSLVEPGLSGVNYLEMTRKMKFLYPDAAGIIFDSFLVVWDLNAVEILKDYGEDKTYLEFTKKELLAGVDGEFRRNDIHFGDLKKKHGTGGVWIKKFFPSHAEFQVKSGTTAGKLYTDKLFFTDGFNYIRKNFKFKDYDISDPEQQKALVEDIKFYIRDIIDNGDIQVSCSCPDFLYAGYKYIGTELDYNDRTDPEHRFPKINNPNTRGVMCKHLRLLITKLDTNSGFKELIVRAMTGKFLDAEAARRYSHTKVKPGWWKQYLK